MNESLATLFLIASAVLAGGCLWLGWHTRRLQGRLRQAEAALEARTAELEDARLDLRRIPTEDSLTALANHEQFLDFLEREWRRGRREGMPISLIFLDVDHFRAFNREFGRRAGDDCLRQIGNVVEGLAGRASDLVARYHRDEFAVVLSSTDIAGAMRVAERIRQAVEALDIPAAHDAGPPFVTVSVAVASVVPARESAWEELDLIKAALHALRDARAAGGNRVLTASIGSPVTTP